MSSSHKARILVVENHPFVREGIVRLINSQKDLMCCGEKHESSSSAPSADEQPDLVLVDLPLNDGIRLESVNSLKLRFPGVPVIVLSQTGDGACVEEALKAGAAGYLTNRGASGEMIDAIHAALNGKRYLSSDIAQRVRASL